MLVPFAPGLPPLAQRAAAAQPHAPGAPLHMPRHLQAHEAPDAARGAGDQLLLLLLLGRHPHALAFGVAGAARSNVTASAPPSTVLMMRATCCAVSGEIGRASCRE